MNRAELVEILASKNDLSKSAVCVRPTHLESDE